MKYKIKVKVHANGSIEYCPMVRNWWGIYLGISYVGESGWGWQSWLNDFERAQERIILHYEGNKRVVRRYSMHVTETEVAAWITKR